MAGWAPGWRMSASVSTPLAAMAAVSTPTRSPKSRRVEARM